MAGLEGGGPTQEIRQPVHYLDPRLKPSPYVVNPATGDRTPGVVLQATGALESLVPAAGSPEPGSTGMWLPDSVASRLHLAAGDPVGLQLAAPGSDPAPAVATVTGIYVTDSDGAPQDPTGRWGGMIDDLPGWPSHLVQTTPQIPLLVADTDTYRALVRGIGETTLVTWDVAPDAHPVRLADLERLDGSVEGLRDELADPSSDFSKQVTHRGNIRVTLSTGLPDMIVGTRAGLRATRDGVAAVRILAAGLSWLVVMLAAVALLVRRRGERQVLVEQGRSVVELTALSVVEAVLPVGLGLLVGWWVSPPFVSAIVGADGVAPRPLVAALVGGVVLATVGVASAADAAARHRRASGRALIAASRVPWRSAVLALAGAGAISIYRGGTGFDAVAGGVPARGGGRRRDHRLDGGHLAAGAAGTTVAAAPAGPPAHPVPAGAGPGLRHGVPRGDSRVRCGRLRVAVPRLRRGRDHGQGRDHRRRQQRLRSGRPGCGRGPRRGHRPVDRGAPNDPPDQRLHRRPAVRGGHGDVRAGGVVVAAVRGPRPVRPAR